MEKKTQDTQNSIPGKGKIGLGMLSAIKKAKTPDTRTIIASERDYCGGGCYPTEAKKGKKNSDGPIAENIIQKLVEHYKDGKTHSC